MEIFQLLLLAACKGRKGKDATRKKKGSTDPDLNWDTYIFSRLPQEAARS